MIVYDEKSHINLTNTIIQTDLLNKLSPEYSLNLMIMNINDISIDKNVNNNDNNNINENSDIISKRNSKTSDDNQLIKEIFNIFDSTNSEYNNNFIFLEKDNFIEKKDNNNNIIKKFSNSNNFNNSINSLNILNGNVKLIIKNNNNNNNDLIPNINNNNININNNIQESNNNNNNNKNNPSSKQQQPFTSKSKYSIMSFEEILKQNIKFINRRRHSKQTFFSQTFSPKIIRSI